MNKAVKNELQVFQQFDESEDMTLKTYQRSQNLI